MKDTMLFGFGMWLFYAALPTMHMCGLMMGSLIDHTPLAPAWSPLDISINYKYYIIWLYQGIGCVFSASNNVTSDTTASFLILHAKTQIERLGIQLSKVKDSTKILETS